MNISEPYFMKNKEWYKYDLSKFKFVLTPEGKKLKKVVASYDDYYSKRSDESPEVDETT